MAHLRRIIDTSHRLGMKIVPYVSLKEFHPEAPGYATHADAWTQAAAPDLRDIHTWIGTGEFGRLMCLQSWWLARRKRDVDTILADLPWDGLCFDWTKPLPCCRNRPRPSSSTGITQQTESITRTRTTTRRGCVAVLMSHSTKSW